ncbi:META domain-containing protein [Motilimonas pumila]|uniref:META domain-containing protein n=1 Tax=Motilimonas pumila TaxID=2303987 RepID=A0A418YA74_9GAMM|nr:META domain-containing protein [Motilimonas pumila]RJG39184.1 META domain-containing protein [Motilimonas pumila]
MKYLTAVTALTATLYLSACQSDEQDSSTPPTAHAALTEIPAGDWLLVQKAQQRFSGEEQPQFVVNADEIVGSDGCNRVKGNYQIVQGRFSSELMGTRKACEPSKMALANAFNQLMTDSQVTLVQQDLVFSGEEEWRFRLRQPQESAADSQGHGPDSGTLESIGALVWQEKYQQATKEAFWLASQNGAPAPLSTISMNDAASLYLINEHSFMALSDALYAGVKRKHNSLSTAQWQKAWINAPQDGSLQQWADFVQQQVAP